MLITIDDASPQISYAPNTPGTWVTNHKTGAFPDVNYINYFDQTFHATYTENATASITFNGSSISVYGSFGQNHGNYSVQLDGNTSEVISGETDERVSQTTVYYADGLNTSVEHTLILTNLPSDASLSNDTLWFDLDYIVIDTGSDDPTFTSIYDDQDAHFLWSDTDWRSLTNFPHDYFDHTNHLTNIAGSTMSFTFNGTSCQIFGGLNHDHGRYSVSLDGGTEEMYNGNWFELLTKIPLYTVNGLDQGIHTIIMTNHGNGSTKDFDVDYAVVNSTTLQMDSFYPSSILTSTISSSIPSESTSSLAETSHHSTSPLAIVVGGAAGTVVGLTLIAVLVWYLLRLRKRSKTRGPIDLVESGTEQNDGRGDQPPRHDFDTLVPDSTTTSSMAQQPYQLAEHQFSQSSLAGANTIAPYLSRVGPPPGSTDSSHFPSDRITSPSMAMNPSGPDPFSDTLAITHRPTTNSRAPPNISYPSTSHVSSTTSQSMTYPSYSPTTMTCPSQTTLSPVQTSTHISRTNPLPRLIAEIKASTSISFTTQRPRLISPVSSSETSNEPNSPTNENDSSWSHHSNGEQRRARMTVFGRETDAGPVMLDEEGEMLPPDYTQATEPLQG
ncbi:hypothetical protein TREMEDRAFT_58395 [Tremella mesenterica DSM 1558]|uniref:uncharacterized protein n=1 Tax=Tremella mesenterica (strain ATCC 24925 / CBS 8224 / DSM 1558 / NBRC 9311 / NRRL Y-6157 / RJB 2259-6 / UBC 559-6) TaxID=578456 RepID=UPI0003F4968B|nr:uncharacterized protein TREMEDRAFT_58395 [Tremella mesenterica DSM 1558]EIW72237.1 hypothetical protein TREMEDRAFT_58395 [Tremella mesenterica DSM 1558]